MSPPDCSKVAYVNSIVCKTCISEYLSSHHGALQKSKSVSKRKREESADATTDADAKKLRQEMRQRGHVTVAKRGEDPLQVQLEIPREILLNPLPTGPIMNCKLSIKHFGPSRIEANE